MFDPLHVLTRKYQEYITDPCETVGEPKLEG